MSRLSPVNEDVLNEVGAYIQLLQPDYAVMLTGNWGTGKTFFLKNNIFPLIAKANLRPLYISLNGLSSVEKLSYLIEEKCMPLKANAEHQKTAMDEARRLEEIVNSVGTKVDESAAIGNIVLCLDDLERLEPILLEKVMGFINTYTEHKNVPTIYLSNEGRLMNQGSDYKQIKEKYISQTFGFESPLIDIIDAWSKNFKGQVNGRLVYSIFETIGCQNIRTWFFAKHFIEKILEKTFRFSELKYIDAVRQDIVEYICSMSIFIKHPQLTKSSGNQYNFRFQSINQYMEGDLRMFDKFLEAEILTAVQNRINREPTREQEIFAMFENPYLIGDEEFVEEVNKLELDLIAGKFGLGVTLQIFSHMLFFESLGVAGVRADKELFIESITRAKEKGNLQYIETLDVFDTWNGSSEYDRRYKTLLYYVYDVNDSLMTKQNRKQTENLLSKILNVKDEATASELENLLAVDARFTFSENDAYLVFSQLVQSGGLAREAFFKGIKRRYQSSDRLTPSGVLQRESLFVAAMKTLLNTHLHEIGEKRQLSDVPLVKMSTVVNSYIDTYFPHHNESRL